MNIFYFVIFYFACQEFQWDINSLVSDQWPENRLHVTTLREIDRTSRVLQMRNVISIYILLLMITKHLH